MEFQAPASATIPPFEAPELDKLTIPEFLFSQGHTFGRHDVSTSKPPFTCGLTGTTYSVTEVVERYESLARALSVELGWQVNSGTEFDKAVAILSLNAIDYLTICWASHRLSGIACPISTSYTVPQIIAQLQSTRCKALFVSAPLFDIALEAAAAAGVPREHVFAISVPAEVTKGVVPPADIKTVDDLIRQGAAISPLPPVDWSQGPSSNTPRTAFICSSSGTGGLPKNVKIAHKNVISNILQFRNREKSESIALPGYSLSVLPQSHAFALIGPGHMNIFQGIGAVVLPSFDTMAMLNCIQKYRIEELWLIPPLVMSLIYTASMLKGFDLDCVRRAWVGSSSLGKDSLDKVRSLLPRCFFGQGYGLTEATCIVSITPQDDFVLGSCGALLPGLRAQVRDPEGKPVSGHDQRGELVIRGPTVVPGYLDNSEATADAMTPDGWLRTGDLVEMRKSSKGNSHIFIIDRIKELIKVHSMQVAPAEIENLLLLHPIVKEAAVVALADDDAGELPRAYIVLNSDAQDTPLEKVKKTLDQHLQGQLPSYKRLAGGIELMDSLPRTGSGKVRRDILRQKSKAFAEERRANDMRNLNEVDAPAPAAVDVIEFDDSDDE